MLGTVQMLEPTSHREFGGVDVCSKLGVFEGAELGKFDGVDVGGELGQDELRGSVGSVVGGDDNCCGGRGVGELVLVSSSSLPCRSLSSTIFSKILSLKFLFSGAKVAILPSRGLLGASLGCGSSFSGLFMNSWIFFIILSNGFSY